MVSVRVGLRFALHSHSKQHALLEQCAVPAHNALHAQLELSALPDSLNSVHCLRVELSALPDIQYTACTQYTA